MTKKSGENAVRAALELQLGAQYLCHAEIDVPESPQVFLTLQAPPHLNLVVNLSLRKASNDESLYELRLVLEGTGLPRKAEENEDLPTVYRANVVYAGIFGLTGEASSEEKEAYLVQNASGYLMPAARAVLLNLIRESGFSTVNPQPVDFREFWHSYKKSN
ncbi:hypothetical protein GS501_00410 [Saccharibacter sp. 17.LH.SD]|uniref:protein-export chaperone SecB n=1 Tax=Saccharibacter sp. 17.LH.SD TaxID=2689393 RepID=UPI0013719182|nr:protein-export chaperone SecB [Saccharibacter sp. 17.LH.SD]MXV43540.1 hypothetical protein [Saccharibacter sp. 17.LH.SD]